jgi:hypothetical protein
MKTKNKRLIVWISLAVLAVVVPLKLCAGRSIRFFLDSGFRAPFNVRVIEAGNRCIGRDGECIFIFETDDKALAWLQVDKRANTTWQGGNVP